MKKKVLLISATLLLVITACSSLDTLRPQPQPEAPSNPTATSMATPAALTPETSDGVIATSVAATIEASESVIATSVASTMEASNSAATLEATRESQPTGTSTPTTPPTMTPTNLPGTSPTASLTPTATMTATLTPSSSSAPMASVSVDTNCRTGPGKVYDRLGVLEVGETAEVVGQKPTYNYWIIKNPDADGECWLWGEYATVTGDTSNLKEYDVPSMPTSTPGTPSSSSTPMASVSVDTNCRTGPGKVYDPLGVLKIGESAEIVGKKTTYNYWIVKNPDADGECWLWGEYAIISGDTSNLKEYSVPPAPTGTSTTPTSAPTVRVSRGTNCRTGPGKAYAIIGGLSVGETAQVVGKKPSLNYWIIKNPDLSGDCWLWGYYATVTGDTSDLPEYDIPAIH